ncbi:3-hydroxyacyl-ACP dehydratase FabZ [Buchnera aphidicola (Pemphigus obesinymphae)]|uniref:3-hydroxyacyl-ACP dehydratase FabZ n=1 Tax=Buchnera aphidicola TaxID=9 RepID=UPI0022381F13|nr:3-hydroxyacyl-ACP dehydratase FabZ [Buchnera aphidicola]MCW5196477.1 3-hydroxyacyl-ACP dehydratase FabZ [Buchnera aphidicola (Pemphigus obesinymphae)]
MNNINVIDVKNIFGFLPHRYPFLFIDRVIEIKKYEYIYAIKNVSINESCFQGHFPNNPIFPGVLIIESMAQASGLLVINSFKNLSSYISYYLASIDRVRFKKIVVPGDQIFIEVVIEKNKKNLTRFRGLAKVNNNIVCKAIITCMLKKN